MLLFGPISIVNSGCEKCNNVILHDYKMGDIDNINDIHKCVKINNLVGLVSDSNILAHYHKDYFKHHIDPKCPNCNKGI
jgi:hypothetical protein